VTSHKSKTIWTFAITSVALFMVTLDNLVVTTALPVIRKDLHASLSRLEWTVNAYTLTLALLDWDRRVHACICGRGARARSNRAPISRAERRESAVRS
jgi:hypothetical protein